MRYVVVYFDTNGCGRLVGKPNDFPSEADALVPLSIGDVKRKKEGILLHKSQNPAPQPGHGVGEFWERAERINAKAARDLKGYGLGDYAAVETFKIQRA